MFHSKTHTINPWSIIFPGMDDSTIANLSSMAKTQSHVSSTTEKQILQPVASSRRARSMSMITLAESAPFTAPPIIDEADVRALILSYLVHHCYEETAQTF